jgi:DNA-binding HxlR family transcriptional regulator
MRDRDEPRAYGRLPPETALSLLSNEVRAAILWHLSERRGGQGPPPVLSFSELRQQAAPDTDSSRFNYHLQELVGPYVERVEADDGWEGASRPVPGMAGEPEVGYQLTPEGTTLIRTIRAWSAAGETDRSLAVDADCHHCGADLSARYEAAILVIECPDCGYLYDYNLTPPGVLTGADDEFSEVDDAAVLDRAAAYNRHVRLSFARGVCPYCGNDVDAEFQNPSETGYPRSDLREALIRRGCSHCGNKDNLTVGELLLREPRVISACLDHGIDVTTTPIWKLPFAATDRHTTVRSIDPWTVAVELPFGDERATLLVDESLTVTEERTAEPSG